MVNTKIEKNEMFDYIQEKKVNPLFLEGDALNILKSIPNQTINCIITSPPYWNKRKYINGGIGLEATYEDFLYVL